MWIQPMGGVMSQSCKKKCIDILSLAAALENMHFIRQAKKIAMFLRVLIGKAFARNGVDMKSHQPQFVDIVGHDNAQVN